MYKWMDNEVHQNQAVTLEVVHNLVDRFGRDFITRKIGEKREGFVDQTIFVLAVFWVVLREKELFKLVLGETRTYFVEARKIRSCLM